MSERLRLLTDEDFDNDIPRVLVHLLPALDLARVRDVGLGGAPDAVILEWVARQGRILLTHDVTTMKPRAYSRVERGQPMPGLFVVSQTGPIGRIIEQLQLLAECSREGEWDNRVLHLPL
jgi:hypothetical protein